MTKSELKNYCEEYFGTKGEHLWEKFPDYTVFRNRDSGKWYCIIMTVKRAKLGLSGEGDADIADFKCDPLMTGSLIMKEGCLPAYHMNKEKWVTVLLEGNGDDVELKSLIAQSYELSGKKKSKK